MTSTEGSKTQLAPASYLGRTIIIECFSHQKSRKYVSCISLSYFDYKVLHLPLLIPVFSQHSLKVETEQLQQETSPGYSSE